MKRRRFRRRQPAQSPAAAGQDPGFGGEEVKETGADEAGGAEQLDIPEPADRSPAEASANADPEYEEPVDDGTAVEDDGAGEDDRRSSAAGDTGVRERATDGAAAHREPVVDRGRTSGAFGHGYGAHRHGGRASRREIRGSGYTGAGSTRPADPLAQARELEQAGQVDRAMNLFREILRTDPDNLEAHFGLGSLYEKIGQHLQALEQFEMAKRVDPENIDAAVRHAKAMATLGRFDAAERDLRRAARIDPNRPEVFTTLGMIGVRRGLYAQAEQDLKRAIELAGDSAAAYHYRGEALNQLGRVDEALGMLEQAASLDPTNPRTYYVMGIVLDKKQRPQEAGAMFRRSRELTPG